MHFYLGRKNSFYIKMVYVPLRYYTSKRSIIQQKCPDTEKEKRYLRYKLSTV